MRKGRSHRRSRVSRPSLVGAKPAQSIEAGPPVAPHVVIGLSDPPLATESGRLEAEAAHGIDRATAVARDLSTDMVPPTDATEETPLVPLASVERLRTPAEGTLDSEPPPAPEASEAAAAKEPATAQTSADTHEAGHADAAPDAPAPPEPAEARTGSDDDTEGPEAASSADEREAAPASVEEAKVVAPVAPVAAATAPTQEEEEEESIPPVGDLAVHEKFFSEGDVAASLPPEPVEDLELENVTSDKAKRKRAPEVVQRRARFVRYVTWAVGVSAVLCLVALVRTAFAPSAKSLATPANAALEVRPPDDHQTEGSKQVVRAPAEPVVEAPAAQPAATETVTSAEPPAVAEAPPAEAQSEQVAEAPAAVDDPTAGDPKAEKTKARKALERHKLAEAIEAGERAVSLDETDAESWLLLGAAYQEKGKLVEARKTFASCVKQAKTGPRGECAAMLR